MNTCIPSGSLASDRQWTPLFGNISHVLSQLLPRELKHILCNGTRGSFGSLHPGFLRLHPCAFSLCWLWLVSFHWNKSYPQLQLSVSPRELLNLGVFLGTFDTHVILDWAQSSLNSFIPPSIKNKMYIVLELFIFWYPATVNNNTHEFWKRWTCLLPV